VADVHALMRLRPLQIAVHVCSSTAAITHAQSVTAKTGYAGYALSFSQQHYQCSANVSAIQKEPSGRSLHDRVSLVARSAATAVECEGLEGGMRGAGCLICNAATL
jgi:hypothetical protein